MGVIKDGRIPAPSLSNKIYLYNRVGEGRELQRQRRGGKRKGLKHILEHRMIFYMLSFANTMHKVLATLSIRCCPFPLLGKLIPAVLGQGKLGLYGQQRKIHVFV